MYKNTVPISKVQVKGSYNMFCTKISCKTLYNRQRRALGVCEDGSAVSQQLVDALVGMGYSRALAAVALRNSNNHVAEAVRLIQEQPELVTYSSSNYYTCL